MHDFLISHQASFRFGIFMAMLGTMMVLELFFSRRVSSLSKQKRWGTNFSIVLTDVVVVRLLFPVAIVEIAMLVQAQGMGLMNNLNMVLSAKFFLSIVLLDLLIYLQHVLFHFVPWFWRLHRVHHTDLEIDSTTGIRFHPLEIILSMLIKMLGVAILGPPVIAVIVYEIILNGASIFNHSNVKIPVKIDALLRWIIVTPDVHRVHHSILRRETDSNYGNFLTCWDRLFRTYRAQPESGHKGMTIGLREFRDEEYQKFSSLLLQPIQNMSRSEL